MFKRMLASILAIAGIGMGGVSHAEDVQPAYCEFNNLPGDALVMTNTVAYVESKVGSVVTPDYSTNNTELVETIEAVAPAPGNYSAVSNAAMNARTKLDLAVYEPVYTYTDWTWTPANDDLMQPWYNGEVWQVGSNDAMAEVQIYPLVTDPDATNIMGEVSFGIGDSSGTYTWMRTRTQTGVRPTGDSLATSNGLAAAAQAGTNYTNALRVDLDAGDFKPWRSINSDYSDEATALRGNGDIRASVDIFAQLDAATETNAAQTAALAGNASTNDVALTPVYSQTPTFSEWVYDNVLPSNWSPSLSYDSISVDGELRTGWFVAPYGYNEKVFVDGDLNSTSLSFAFDGDDDSSFTATRTRTDIIGYTLGSQTDKVLGTTNATINLSSTEKIVYGNNLEVNEAVTPYIAIGTDLSSPTNYSINIGYEQTVSNGLYATAVGAGNLASADYASAYGIMNKATSPRSFAMGILSEASGLRALAIGNKTLATNENTVAVGNQGYNGSTVFSTEASGIYATALGSGAMAKGKASTALGALLIAGGEYTTAIGSVVDASGDQSVGIGYTTFVPAPVSVGIGKEVYVGYKNGSQYPSKNNVAIGIDVRSCETNSVVIGVGSSVTNNKAVSIGYNVVSHGEGTFNVNPTGGLSGFYVGDTPLSQTLGGYVTQYDGASVRQELAQPRLFGNITVGYSGLGSTKMSFLSGSILDVYDWSQLQAYGQTLPQYLASSAKPTNIWNTAGTKYLNVDGEVYEYSGDVWYTYAYNPTEDILYQTGTFEWQNSESSSRAARIVWSPSDGTWSLYGWSGSEWFLMFTTTDYTLTSPQVVFQNGAFNRNSDASWKKTAQFATMADVSNSTELVKRLYSPTDPNRFITGDGEVMAVVPAEDYWTVSGTLSGTFVPVTPEPGYTMEYYCDTLPNAASTIGYDGNGTWYFGLTTAAGDENLTSYEWNGLTWTRTYTSSATNTVNALVTSNYTGNVALTGNQNITGNLNLTGNQTLDGNLIITGKVSNGYGAKANGYGSHAEGHHTIAGGVYSHADGYYSNATNSYAYVWNGDTSRGSSSRYGSRGNGTYCLNPVNDLYGFFIGTNNFNDAVRSVLLNTSEVVTEYQMEESEARSPGVAKATTTNQPIRVDKIIGNLRRYPLFIIDLNPGEARIWQHLELKATTNNFDNANADNMIFFTSTTCNMDDPANWRLTFNYDWCRIYMLSKRTGDVRSWTRIYNTGELDGYAPSQLAIIVDPTLFKRGQGAEWLYEGNNELVWSYVRIHYDEGETDPDGKGSWRPIMPVKWFDEIPKWADDSPIHPDTTNITLCEDPTPTIADILNTPSPLFAGWTYIEYNSVVRKYKWDAAAGRCYRESFSGGTMTYTYVSDVNLTDISNVSTLKTVEAAQ